MLTRLRVSGFKNLVDVNVRFGPFTCVAGANGTGKSNLFDAIQFLSALADQTLIDAALSVRGEGGRAIDIQNLFHRAGETYSDEMSFVVEMIVPKEGVDDLGQKAVAATTLLRYSLVLSYRDRNSLSPLGSLEIKEEKLERVRVSDAAQYIRFPHSTSWRQSVAVGKGRRTPYFISTEIDKEGKRVIKLHQEGVQGRPRSYLASNLPRTVLSAVNAIESPTTLLARREMQSWRLLRLEPSALRRPDELTTLPGIGLEGSHLPATLYYLALSDAVKELVDSSDSQMWVYDQVAGRLSELIDVYEVRVDRDDQRQLLTIEVQGRDRTPLPARSLSDGTLRFLALAVLELDPETRGLICLEEPENGIHPDRIPAMLRLLQDIATGVDSPIGVDNPLRQVIVNTHSPAVVSLAPDGSLIVAELKEVVRDGKRSQGARFSWLPDTWRATVSPDVAPVARGKLLAYLGKVPANGQNELESATTNRGKVVRVIDRPDLQMYLPGFGVSG